MEIRHSKAEDLPDILRIYQCAREYMEKSNNPNQWGKMYPYLDIIKNDIEEKLSYVVADEGRIHGVFVFFKGIEHDYDHIEGAWKNNEPYGVIHRIASDGETRGIFQAAISYAESKCNNLRIDTHDDNKTMQHLLIKAGFEYCGTIYVRGNESRRAYHYSATL